MTGVTIPTQLIKEYTIDQATDVAIEDRLFNLSQLKEVWYLGMLNGATLWQVCQDNTTDKKSSFEKITNELKTTVTSEQSLKDVASSNLLLLGVACEVLNITELK